MYTFLLQPKHSSDGAMKCADSRRGAMRASASCHIERDKVLFTRVCTAKERVFG